MKIPDYAVCLYRGRGLISAAIRFQTRSQYSHASLLMPGGVVVESWHTKGVRIMKVEDWENIDLFGIQGFNTDDWEKAIAYALSFRGASYDWIGVLRFVSRRKCASNARWFCSELVFEAIEHAGLPLLRGIPACEVSPALLSMSPFLYPIGYTYTRLSDE